MRELRFAPLKAACARPIARSGGVALATRRRRG
jgi:hypothetical protein